MTFDDFQHGVREMPFVGKVSWAIGRMVPTTGSVFLRLQYNSFLLLRMSGCAFLYALSVNVSQVKTLLKTFRYVDWVVLHVFLFHLISLYLAIFVGLVVRMNVDGINISTFDILRIPYSITSYYLREDSGMKLHILPFFFYHPLIDKLLISRNFLEWHLYSIASNP